MAPSMDINIAMEDIKMEKKKRKKSKNLTDAVEEVNAEDSDEASKKKKKKKKKKDSCSIAVVGKEEEATLIQMIAKYLDKRKLHKTLSSFLSETQCESSWKIQVMDLEDIFNQYSNRYSENLKKHNIENREDHVNQHNILKLQEPEVQRKYVNNVVNSKGTLSMSGALKQQVPRSDKSDGSCDDTQEGISKSKNKKHKGPRKDICLDSDKTPKQTDSGKFDKSLQESLEVPKEKKKKKKMSEDNNLIDNDEHKTSTDNGNENFSKGNRKPSKQTDSGKRDKSFQESLEVQKEEKKKKNSDDKDLIDNDEQETSVDKEIGNSIKDNSKPSETSLKQRDSEKLDKSLQESQEAPKEKKKKKKSFEDEDSIKNVDEKSVTNNKDENLTKDNSKPSKSSKKSKHNLQLDESLHGSVEVPKEKRKKENAEEKDSGDHDKQNNAKKIKKGKKEFNNKLQSSSSNVINEETIEGNVKNLSEDTDKLLDDTTPGQKGFKADKDQTNISSNSKQKSGEPTSAKAFQRVKLEEVEFVDPRLQDNSYWAKSGAEIGYGAKAEEVLGQVRGRDFRHEKTKKKRGSYKGGMIDLQSHSIKFSYSDEE